MIHKLKSPSTRRARYPVAKNTGNGLADPRRKNIYIVLRVDNGTKTPPWTELLILLLVESSEGSQFT
jgi:hypothetical protein